MNTLWCATLRVHNSVSSVQKLAKKPIEAKQKEKEITILERKVKYVLYSFA